MLDTVIGRLRAVGLLEGSSFLVLLGVAMPLKYLAGMPLAVKVVGWVHGLLFLLYVAALAAAHGERRWPARRLLALFVAALVPFGPFLADGMLRREEQAVRLAAQAR